MKVGKSAETYQVGAHFKALLKAILVAPSRTLEKFFKHYETVPFISKVPWTILSKKQKSTVLEKSPADILTKKRKSTVPNKKSRRYFDQKRAKVPSIIRTSRDY